MSGLREMPRRLRGASRRQGRITLRGLLAVLVPLVVVGKSIQHAHKVASKTVGQATSFLGEFAPSKEILEGTGFAVAILLGIVAFCWLLGWVMTRTTFGQRVVAWEDTVFFKRSPLVQKVVSKKAKKAPEPSAPPQPALAHVGGGWQPGVVIEEQSEGWTAMFLPDIPSTTTGRLFYLPPDQVRRLDVPLEEFRKTLAASGHGSKDWLKPPTKG